MRALWQSCVRFFTSLQLTVVLLVLSILLVFVATLDQVNLGVWAVQQKYFHSFFVMARLGGSGLAIPVFPGGDWEKAINDGWYRNVAPNVDRSK